MAYSLYLYSAAGGVTARAMKLASVVPRTTEVRRRRRLQKINMLVCDIVRMRKLCTVVVLHPCDDYGVLVLDTARWTMKRYANTSLEIKSIAGLVSKSEGMPFKIKRGDNSVIDEISLFYNMPNLVESLLNVASLRCSLSKRELTLYTSTVENGTDVYLRNTIRLDALLDELVLTFCVAPKHTCRDIRSFLTLVIRTSGSLACRQRTYKHQTASLRPEEGAKCVDAVDFDARKVLLPFFSSSVMQDEYKKGVAILEERKMLKLLAAIRVYMATSLVRTSKDDFVFFGSFLHSIMALAGYGRALASTSAPVQGEERENDPHQIADAVERAFISMAAQAEEKGFLPPEREKWIPTCISYWKSTSAGVSPETVKLMIEGKEITVQVRKKAAIGAILGKEGFSRQRMAKRTSIESPGSVGYRDVPYKPTRLIYVVPLSTQYAQIAVASNIVNFVSTAGAANAKYGATIDPSHCTTGSAASTGIRLFDNYDTIAASGDPGILAIGTDLSSYDANLRFWNFRKPFLSALRRISADKIFGPESIPGPEMVHYAFGEGIVYQSYWDNGRTPVYVVKKDIDLKSASLAHFLKYIQEREVGEDIPKLKPLAGARFLTSGKHSFFNVEAALDDGVSVPWEVIDIRVLRDGSDLTLLTSEASGELTTLAANTIVNLAMQEKAIAWMHSSPIGKYLTVKYMKGVGDDAEWLCSMTGLPSSEEVDFLLDGLTKLYDEMGHKFSPAKTYIMPLSSEYVQTYARFGLYIPRDQIMVVASEKPRSIRDSKGLPLVVQYTEKSIESHWRAVLALWKVQPDFRFYRACLNWETNNPVNPSSVYLGTWKIKPDASYHNILMGRVRETMTYGCFKPTQWVSFLCALGLHSSLEIKSIAGLVSKSEGMPFKIKRGDNSVIDEISLFYNMPNLVESLLNVASLRCSLSKRELTLYTSTVENGTDVYLRNTIRLDALLDELVLTFCVAPKHTCRDIRSFLTLVIRTSGSLACRQRTYKHQTASLRPEEGAKCVDAVDFDARKVLLPFFSSSVMQDEYKKGVAILEERKMLKLLAAIRVYMATSLVRTSKDDFVFFGSFLHSIMALAGYGRALASTSAPVQGEERENDPHQIADAVERAFISMAAQAEEKGFLPPEREKWIPTCISYWKSTSAGVSPETVKLMIEGKEITVQVRKKAAIGAILGKEGFSRQRMAKRTSIESPGSVGYRDVPYKPTRLIYVVPLSTQYAQIAVASNIVNFVSTAGAANAKYGATIDPSHCTTGSAASTGIRLFDNYDTIAASGDPGILAIGTDLSSYDANLRFWNFRKPFLSALRRISADKIFGPESIPGPEMVHYAFGEGIVYQSYWDNGRTPVYVVKKDIDLKSASLAHFLKYIQEREVGEDIPKLKPLAGARFLTSGKHSFFNVEAALDDGVSVPWEVIDIRVLRDGSDLTLLTSEASGELTTLAANTIVNLAMQEKAIAWMHSSPIGKYLTVKYMKGVGDDAEWLCSMTGLPSSEEVDFLLDGLTKLYDEMGHKFSPAKTYIMPLSSEYVQTYARFGLYIPRDQIMVVASEKPRSIRDSKGLPLVVQYTEKSIESHWRAVLALWKVQPDFRFYRACLNWETNNPVNPSSVYLGTWKIKPDASYHNILMGRVRETMTYGCFKPTQWVSFLCALGLHSSLEIKSIAGLVSKSEGMPFKIKRGDNSVIDEISLFYNMPNLVESLLNVASLRCSLSKRELTLYTSTVENGTDVYLRNTIRLDALLDELVLTFCVAPKHTCRDIRSFLTLVIRTSGSLACRQRTYKHQTASLRPEEGAKCVDAVDFDARKVLLPFFSSSVMQDEYKKGVAILEERKMLKLLAAIRVYMATSLVRTSKDDFVFFGSFLHSIMALAGYGRALASTSAPVQGEERENDPHQIADAVERAFISMAAQAEEKGFLPPEREKWIPTCISYWKSTP
ncbi:hypothetical protein ACJJTC_008663 [Scirpophaga incertulas]